MAHLAQICSFWPPFNLIQAQIQNSNGGGCDWLDPLLLVISSASYCDLDPLIGREWSHDLDLLLGLLL